MTRAPSNLLAVRSLLLKHLNPSPVAREDDLEPAEVGIVGDAAHRGGYHCGSNRVVTGDYSVVESPRDRNGLTTDASALDVGWFSVRVGKNTHNLRTFSAWVVAQCIAGTPDSRDIREVIYSPDGRTVRRWDRLGRRASGDTSHLWHTHFSFFRDSTKAARDQTPLFRRYLHTIGLLPAPTPETTMTNINPNQQIPVGGWLATRWPTDKGLQDKQLALGTLLGSGYGHARAARETIESSSKALLAELKAVRAGQAATLAAVQGLDTTSVLARIEQVAAEAAARDEAAARRDAEMAEMIRSWEDGTVTAEVVLHRLGEIITNATPGG